MSRPRTKQARLSAKERRAINEITKKLKAYQIFNENWNDRETRFNDRILHHLKQSPSLANLSNKKIPTASLAGETFRPEFYLKFPKLAYPTCAVEVKRLTKKFAKTRFKEGLSQALTYLSPYKFVVLLLLDFTPSRSYCRKFSGAGNTTEKQFVKWLSELLNIKIIVIAPTSLKRRKIIRR